MNLGLPPALILHSAQKLEPKDQQITRMLQRLMFLSRDRDLDSRPALFSRKSRLELFALNASLIPLFQRTYPKQIGIDPLPMDWGNPDAIKRGPVVVSRSPSTIRRRNGL